MAIDRTAILTVPAAAMLLLWPAVWNGFPIVFADTGTYLSQAINHYAGWDRPIFYSLFMLPLHLTVTVWPVVVVQALLAAWVAWLVVRALAPDVSSIAFIAGAAVLSICTWLPWLVSELMPDLFTPLLVLVLCLLAWVPERLSSREQIVLVGLAAFMIASQLSSLPLACVLGAVLGFARPAAQAFPSVSWPGPARPPTTSQPPQVGTPPSPATTRTRTTTLNRTSFYLTTTPRRWLLIVLPPALAVLAACSVNLASFGRFETSPFGNIFLLARVIYDGPGMTVLRRDCPTANWRLCPFLDSFPPTSDDFLWTTTSPLRPAGGAKAVSRDAGAIIKAALLADPIGEARAALDNTLEQMTRFASGDGLTPWPAQVTPWIERDFPAREQAAYASARQQAGTLSVPSPLSPIHTMTALAGVIACAILLPVAFKRRAACAGFLLAVLLALPLSAAITGGLSAPHERYQARIMWLAPFVAIVSLASLRRRPA
jgi:hypothetical protein